MLQYFFKMLNVIVFFPIFLVIFRQHFTKCFNIFWKCWNIFRIKSISILLWQQRPAARQLVGRPATTRSNAGCGPATACGSGTLAAAAAGSGLPTLGSPTDRPRRRGLRMGRWLPTGRRWACDLEGGGSAWRRQRRCWPRRHERAKQAKGGKGSGGRRRRACTRWRRWAEKGERRKKNVGFSC
jgi:hypothetical protein